MYILEEMYVIKIMKLSTIIIIPGDNDIRNTRKEIGTGC